MHAEARAQVPALDRHAPRSPESATRSTFTLYRPEFGDKVAITGNPRFDTLLPGVRCVYNREAEAIRETFGRFILVNTNFGRPNPFRPADDPVAKLIARGMIAEGSEADFIRRHVDFKRWQMQGLQDLLRELAASGAVEKIVIRPHPVENHDVWREWGKPLNIDVRFEGSANNWMMAADAVVHPGCTTGIEGLLLDRAVFSYVPDANSEFIGEQDRASVCVSNVEELSNGLARMRGLDQQDVRKGLTAQRERLRRSVVNVEQPFAADRRLSTTWNGSMCGRFASMTWEWVAASFQGSFASAGEGRRNRQTPRRRTHHPEIPQALPRKRSGRRLRNGPTPNSLADAANCPLPRPPLGAPLAVHATCRGVVWVRALAIIPLLPADRR